MKNIYLHLSLITTVILLFFVSNIFVADSINYWYYTPNLIVNVTLLVISIFLIIFGIKKRQSKEQLIYGIAISILLVSTACILSISAFYSPLEIQEHVETIQSPDKTRTLEVYFMEKELGSYDKVIVYETGTLWFKRLIYTEDDQRNIQITWNTENEVVLNETTLDLTNMETIILTKEAK